MEKFTDRLGREWLAEIDNSMIGSLREYGLDLAAFPREESDQAVKEFGAKLMGVLMDPERFGNILSVICQEQIAEQKLDARGFARGFNADALCAATDAVLLACFDHVLRRPELRARVRDRLPKMWAGVDAEVAGRLEG